jgi:hypothetical protein
MFFNFVEIIFVSGGGLGAWQGRLWAGRIETGNAKTTWRKYSFLEKKNFFEKIQRIFIYILCKMIF